MQRRTITILIGGAACAVWLFSPGAGIRARQGSVISALATNAITGPLASLAEAHKRQTGTAVTIEFDTSPSIARRVAAGDVGVDVLVTSTAGIDRAIKDGKAIAGSRAAVGKVGVGVAIRRGARRPDISSADALKASILSADRVIYTQGASGVYIEKLLQSLGIADEVKARAVQVATGDAMLERLAASPTSQRLEIGFTQMSEIKRAETHSNVTLVGPLPAAIQNYTVFEAVVMTGSRAPEAARAFVAALTSPAGRKELAANAWEF